MNILLTGWEGTVGSSLLEFLKLKGQHVTCFEGDIRDKDAWEQYKTKQWNGLIHLAAIPGVRKSFENPEEYYDNNVNGTARAFEFADKWVDKTLYASSSNAYEWYGNPYASTKKMNEIQAVGRRAIGMRFHTVWPGRPDMLFKKLLNKEVTYINQHHYRDWIHIDDLCEGIWTIWSNFESMIDPYPVVDIGTGHAYPVAEVARLMGYDGEYVTEAPRGERTVTKANIEPLLEFGWTPKRNIINEASDYK
jgi:UDP-glucuronate 4-epimerase